MFTISKKPAEIIPVTCNFNKVLPSGETLNANSTVIAVDKNGNNMGNNMIVASVATSPNLTATVQAGNNGSTYILSFKGATSPGNYVFEEEIALNVNERG